MTSTYDSNEVKMNYVQQFHYFSIDAGAGYHHRSFERDRLDSLDLFPWHLILRGQNPPAPDEDPRSHMLLSLRQDFNDFLSLRDVVFLLLNRGRSQFVKIRKKSKKSK